MNRRGQISGLRILLLLCSVGLFLIWLMPRVGSFISTQNGMIRVILGCCFSLLIILRPKLADRDDIPGRSWLLVIAALAGVLLAIFGLILGIPVLRWLGILFLFGASLCWSLPQRYRGDIVLGLLLVYWIHPLPVKQVFAPFQFAMQSLSVHGSEWLLHMLNIRVWADKFVLYTGSQVFEIPSWCSGMRTATTVFILSLGVGILKRLRWFDIILVTLAAVMQALILNIIRISAMVILAPRLEYSVGYDYLHNTASIIVLASVLLTYLEIIFVRRHRVRRRERKQEINLSIEHVLDEHPPFWRFLRKHYRALTMTLIAILAGAGLAYKSRPTHRAEMLKDVAERLRDEGQLDKAEQLAMIIESLVPNDYGWRTTTVRLLIIRNKFERALKILEGLEPENTSQLIEKKILTAYALMGMSRLDESAAIVDTLPSWAREEDPYVAMILAELAVRADDPDKAASHIVKASEWRPNNQRIRSIYPYLRHYRKWDAMSESDSNVPYINISQALSAAEAYMNLNKSSDVAQVTLDAMKKWPRDYRILEPLFYLAISNLRDNWEAHFSDHLRRCLPELNDPDILYRLFDHCFDLMRPDLAWLLYSRIQSIDPSHPYLDMAATRYGDRWFIYRKQFLHIPSSRAREAIDIKPLYIMGLSLKSWIPLLNSIPLGQELSVPDIDAARKSFLKKAISEFASRFQDSRPETTSDSRSATMHYEYVRALDMADNLNAALRELDRIPAMFPKEADRAMARKSELYQAHNDWQNVYETLRMYGDLTAQTTDDVRQTTAMSNVSSNTPALEDSNNSSTVPLLRPMLRLCEAQLRLKMGLAAIYTAEQAVRLFPHSGEARYMLAIALDLHDSPEHALFVLRQPTARRARGADNTELYLLIKTQRYSEIPVFCETAFLPKHRIPNSAPQARFLPPAEAAVMWHRIFLPSKHNTKEAAETLRANLKTITSPFFKKMVPLWLEAYADNTTEDSSLTQVSGFSSQPSLVARWADCGRDRFEKATALNQLSLLLCQQDRMSEARIAAQEATKFFPESPMLWHILISLSGGDTNVVAKAREACPTDPEIWLAEVVTSLPLLPSPHSGLKSQVSSLSSNLPPTTLARAAEFLLRKGHKKDAAEIMRKVIPVARGLLPVYTLGIRCALSQKDKDWAITCTELAIRSALRPTTMLYKQLVRLKVERNSIAADMPMVQALKELRQKEPDDPMWAAMLGFIRFQRGDWETVDSLYQLSSAIESGATNRMPFIVAAEAARQFTNYDRAAELLRKGLKLHPKDPALLNNLVYTLGSTPKAIADNSAELLQLIPQLREVAGEGPNTLDTIAVAYMHTGDFEKAATTLETLLKEVKNGTVLWFNARLHQAEMAFSEDNFSLTIEIIEDMFRNTGSVPDSDILKANRLLLKARDALSIRQTTQDKTTGIELETAAPRL